MADPNSQPQPPLINDDAEASRVAQLIQGGQINGAARDSAMAALRQYASAKDNQTTQSDTGQGETPSVSHAAESAVGTVLRHPFTAAPAMVEGAIEAQAGALGRDYGRVRNLVTGHPMDENLPDWGGAVARHLPQTEAGQELGQEGTEAGQAINQETGTGPTAMAIKHGIGVVGDAAAALPIPSEARALGSVGKLADRAVNAVTTALRGEAPELANTGIPEAVRNGYHALPSGVKAANPAAETVAGTARESIDPNARLRVQQHNSAQATADVAGDIPELAKTPTAIQPSDIDAAKAPRNQIYDEFGRQAGTHPGSDQLMSDLDAVASNSRATTATARAAIAQNVEHYKAQFATVSGPEAVQTVRDLRQTASKLMASSDVNQQAEGYANRQIANAVENELMRNVPADSPIAREFVQARQDLAKLHDITAVTQRGAGQVDPQAVANLARAGAPLSGGLARVAQAAQAMPGEMVHPMSWSGGSAMVPGSHVGVIRKLIGELRHLPGMDVASEGFQEAHYGAPGEPIPEGHTPPVELTPPAGTVGQTPQQGSLGSLPQPAARPPAELTPPEGTAHEPYQQPLRGYEPNREPMARAEWDQAALKGIKPRRHIGEPQ